MNFTSLGGSDAKVINLKVHGDNRGSFARVWCTQLFKEAGIEFSPVQGNTSLTKTRGAVRGMHFQRAPYADAKVVRCSHGRIHDVIVDLREGSATLGESFHIELGAEDGRMLYIPAGFAHGFQAVSEDAVVEYLMGVAYHPEFYDGARYDDPLISIKWPEPVTEISEKDLAWPDLAGRMPFLRRSAA
ncbi:dTDP-4-dehydrorhamnose 3,5-epimerase [Neorhizobium sp. NCHU2750]|uniref:dTDP-4-dehydrorhamnose 3,5-epimerase family protein n=1 Tax=Neorhizobium sp. NCHU2750 TaxID=1825976 RepID=UPI000E708D36|nr:dTDP-4-dehydrorhamnose 3,5-epimerase [Neorhizobium sp. NCHU2750]